MSEDEAVKLTTAGYTADDYDGDAHVPAEEALRRLVEGNRIYVEALDHERDLSQERIADLFENGQRPFACVITCADSPGGARTRLHDRVGRAVRHPRGGQCGGAHRTGQRRVCLRALAHPSSAGAGAHPLRRHQGGPRWEAGRWPPSPSASSRPWATWRDPYEASVANARAAAAELAASPELARLAAEHDLDIRVAIYHTHCGVVDFLQRGSEILTLDGEIPLLK